MGISQFPDPSDRYIICTAGTRPSAPYEGLLIYQTDNDLMLVYDGSGWRVAGRGEVSQLEFGLGTAARATGATFDTQTITAPYGAGIPYRMSIYIHVVADITAGNVWDLYLQRPSGTNIRGSRGTTASGVTTQIIHDFFSFVDVTDGTDTSLRFTVTRTGGAGTWGANADGRFNRVVVIYSPL